MHEEWQLVGKCYRGKSDYRGCMVIVKRGEHYNWRVMQGKHIPNPIACGSCIGGGIEDSLEKAISKAREIAIASFKMDDDYLGDLGKGLES